MYTSVTRVEADARRDARIAAPAWTDVAWSTRAVPSMAASAAGVGAPSRGVAVGTNPRLSSLPHND